MSAHKDVVQQYVEAFRASDHAALLATLHDDVVWTLHGYRTLVGKDAFDAEVENPVTPGRPTLRVDKLVEDGDTVVAIGSGEVSLGEGGGMSFAFCDVFEFEGELIKEVQSHQVNLNRPGRDFD